MSNEIDALISQLLQRSEHTEELDTSEAAKKLISAWSEQTETFSQPPKPKSRVAHYRKLDTPMMVAKKNESVRPSVDPTIIMEARRKHVLEMREQRLKKMADKQNTVPQSIEVTVEIPNVEEAITKKRKEVKLKLAQNKKQMEARVKKINRMKRVEEIIREDPIVIPQEEDEKEKEQQLAIHVSLFEKQRKAKESRKYFTKWVDKCSFHTQLYDKASKFDSFHKLSAYFRLWKVRFNDSTQKRELKEIEKRLRRERRMEEVADKMVRVNAQRKYFIRWKSLFKAQNELKLYNEIYKQRNQKLLERIKPEQPKESPPPKKEVKKTKIKPIKVDPKIEEMNKRMEEEKKKRIEKAQLRAQKATEDEEKRAKIELEKQKKQRAEHLKALEEEKRRRDEIKMKQIEYQKQIQRKKYVEKISLEYNVKRMSRKYFRQWRKIGVIRLELEQKAEDFQCLVLARKVIRCWRKVVAEEEASKMAYYGNYRNEVLENKALVGWREAVEATRGKEEEVVKVREHYLRKAGFEMVLREMNRRRKEKYAHASQYSDWRLIRFCVKAWKLGIEVIKEEERRKKDREDLMSKALRFLDEIEDSSS